MDHHTNTLEERKKRREKIKEERTEDDKGGNAKNRIKGKATLLSTHSVVIKHVWRDLPTQAIYFRTILTFFTVAMSKSRTQLVILPST